eukprot:3083711-Rhodomonas_salina.3
MGWAAMGCDGAGRGTMQWDGMGRDGREARPGGASRSSGASACASGHSATPACTAAANQPTPCLNTSDRSLSRTQAPHDPIMKPQGVSRFDTKLLLSNDHHRADGQLLSSFSSRRCISLFTSSALW